MNDATWNKQREIGLVERSMYVSPQICSYAYRETDRHVWTLGRNVLLWDACCTLEYFKVFFPDKMMKISRDIL